MKNLFNSKWCILGTFCVLSLWPQSARASIAYGSVNNFDTVNDTGSECHGFEIELDDCHSTDVTYTYNYNHYGVPNITEDNSVPAHPKVVIRWESKKNLDGTWAAYTAIPAGPIPPTQGHQFTNPAVNFGGEHFGCGYSVQPSAVLYNWLIDGGGVLVHGGAVQVATPTFTYFPPVVGNPVPAVQAVIVPPPPPVPPPLEFGKAIWVKEIKTTTHNNKEVKLRELVSADPDHPERKNWKNGEPDEVEVEWRILQKSSVQPAGGAKNQLVAAAENLPGGDEVITRRYEFYKYVGPLDAETGEAMGDLVGPDGLHGSGSVTYADHFDLGTYEWVTVTTDMSTVLVVGDFTGSQMAAVDVAAPVGLIDHCGDGRINTPFAARTVVVEGSHPFTAVRTGDLPQGMNFDEVTGVLDGTPIASGTFTFKITASDGLNPDVAKNYTLTIAAAGAVLPPANLLDTADSPIGSGTTTGDGSYDIDANATATATPAPGFAFLNWTDNSVVVSSDPNYTLAMNVNHSLVANFVPVVVQWNITTSAAPVAGGTTTGDGLANDGTSVTVVATPNAGYSFTNWTVAGVQVSPAASYTFTATADVTLAANFTVLPTYAVSTSAVPLVGGSTSGGGSYVSGSRVTVVATPNAGYNFVNWTEGGTQVSSSASYAFNIAAARSLVANFSPTGVTLRTIATSITPAAGGTTTGAGVYADGSSVTVVAIPASGYKFSNWKEGGTTVSTAASYTFTATANHTLVASFTISWSITATASPSNAGTTEMDSSSYKVGDTAQARVKTTAAGYQFVNWTENGVVVSTLTPYSFPATGNRTLVANFLPTYQLALTSSSASMGTVSGGGTFVSGTNVTATAAAKPGYIFLKWTEAGTTVSTSPSFAFTLLAQRNLVGNFALGFTVAATSSFAPGGSVTGAGNYATGGAVTLIATPSAGYQFTNWTEGGTVVSNSASYGFTAGADHTFVANFIPIVGITNTAPGILGIAWPVSATGWILQETHDLSPASWVTSARQVTTSGPLNQVSVSNPTGKLFFRLVHP